MDGSVERSRANLCDGEGEIFDPQESRDWSLPKYSIFWGLIYLAANADHCHIIYQVLLRTLQLLVTGTPGM